jgi:hypothetical protein
MRPSFVILAMLGVAAGLNGTLAPWGTNPHSTDVPNPHSTASPPGPTGVAAGPCWQAQGRLALPWPRRNRL